MNLDDKIASLETYIAGLKNQLLTTSEGERLAIRQQISSESMVLVALLESKNKQAGS